MFRWIEDNPELGKVDICIPNAGFSTSATLMEGRVIRSLINHTNDLIKNQIFVKCHVIKINH